MTRVHVLRRSIGSYLRACSVPATNPKNCLRSILFGPDFIAASPTDRQSQSPLQNWIDVQLIFSLFDFSGKYAAVLLAAQCDRAHTITRYNDRPLIFEFK